MKNNIIWFAITLLMILSLVISSCGQKEEEKAKITEEDGQIVVTKEETKEDKEEVAVEKEMVTLTLTKLDGTTMVKTKEKPQYGGKITNAITSDYYSMDPYLNRAILVWHMQLTSNELMQGNWALGPAGTGDVDWMAGYQARIELETGELAESWDMPDDETIIYHLRKGIHYWNKPPINGRELVAEDVAWWLDAQYNVKGLWQNIAFPPEQRPTSFKALDKYTVEVKVPAAYQGIALMEMGDNAYTNPPELWTQYGGIGNDWSKFVGSGPFIMTDYVTSTSATYIKNPDYWEFSPIHPGDRWPYIDTYKELIMPDVSTKQAAFRTGKLDYLVGLKHEDKELLLKQHPQILQNLKPRYLGLGIPAGRIDKPPFDDIRVRQAMNLAVNKQEILDDYYLGDADMHAWPAQPTETYKPYYTPLDECPEEVQMLFTYDVAKAKQLMAEAGYPNGFKTTIICQTLAEDVDMLSLIKEYLLAIGIDMEIKPIDYGQWNSIRTGHQQQPGNMFYGPGVYATDQPLSVKPGAMENHGFVNDPYYDNLFLVIARDLIKDPQNFQKTVKDAIVYQLASAWGIWLPRAHAYTLWWPWVKDYEAISMTGWAGERDWHKSIWVDQALKKSMGY
jgi:peptide/nickel transport system substrate-binding protein